MWTLSLAWIIELFVEPIGPLFLLLSGVGVVVAIATLIEPAWVGSPIRRLVQLSIPVALVGSCVAVMIT